MAKQAASAAKVENREIMLTNVRASYLHVFKAFASNKTNEDGQKSKPKFRGTFILPKKTHKSQIEEIDTAIEEMIEEAWGERPKKLTDDRICFKDGDDEDAEEYAKAMIITASNSKRPQIRDRDKSPLAEEDGKPYSGCYVNVLVRLWVQDNEFGKRINASLEIVQFYKDGAAFGPAQVDADKYLEDLDAKEGKGSKKSKRSRDEDDDEDEPAPKKKSRSRDFDEDDDDDKPAKKSRKSRDDDEDEEDDKPAKKKRRVVEDDEDDEEEEAPRRRRGR